MSDRNIEQVEGSQHAENGHCKGCCDKWQPIKRPKPQYGLRYFDAYRLEWTESQPCTCPKSCICGFTPPPSPATKEAE